jgi:aspartate/methionine/tyrosine aminotransferase
MKKPALSLNPVVEAMPEAMSIFVNQMVYDYRRAGDDVITLSLGEAFFDVPLFDFSVLDVEGSFHYSESRGLLALRQRFAKYYGDRYGAEIDARDEILVSAGSKSIIFMAMLTALAPGDEVLIPEPSWLSYPEQARLIGAVPRFIPFDRKPAEFAEFITPKTRMLILCNPNNPAGRVYTADELTVLYRTCRERGIYVMVDEAYSDFVFDEKFASIANLVPDKDGIIVVNSISKSMGMSGWRIGYAIAHPTFISQLLKVNQHIITCAPTILLFYCDRYFDDLLAVTLPQVRKVVEKRRRIQAIMDGVGIDRLSGGATFYFFVSIGSFPGTSNEFALSLLLNKRIAVVPGSAYGQSTDRFVRISIGTESEDRISAALSEIRRLTEANTLDREMLARQVSEFNDRVANKQRASV